MKTYEIGVFEEQGGYMQVKAKSEKQAEKIAEEYINNYGFEMSEKKQKNILGIRVTHREVHLI